MNKIKSTIYLKKTLTLFEPKSKNVIMLFFPVLFIFNKEASKKN